VLLGSVIGAGDRPAPAPPCRVLPGPAADAAGGGHGARRARSSTSARHRPRYQRGGRTCGERLQGVGCQYNEGRAERSGKPAAL